MLAPNISRRLFSAGLAAGAAALSVRGTRALLAHDLSLSTEEATIRALAEGVLGWVRREIGPGDFATGSRRFSGEWAFGTLAMAALGLAQLAKDSPEERATLASAIEGLVDRMVDPSVSAFSREAWGSDPFTPSLASPEERLDGHAAYLGYLNLAIGLLRNLTPDSRHSDLGRKLTEGLRLRVATSPFGLVETYPRETYPVDNAALLASIHLGERASGESRDGALDRGLAAIASSITKDTGLLMQSVDPDTSEPRDSARGSGSCLAVYFLAFVDLGMSRALWDSVKAELIGQVLGFRAVREYPRGVHANGDVDSGPVILGWGVSASGFALAGARIHGDEAIRRDLYATASLFGAPTRVPMDSIGGKSADGIRFVTGGPLGDALLLAMLTARRSWNDDPQESST